MQSLYRRLTTAPRRRRSLARAPYFPEAIRWNAAIAGRAGHRDSHGGAIEQAARHLQDWAKKEGGAAALADQMVDWMKEKKIRMPGFGHRLHNVDPRTASCLRSRRVTGTAAVTSNCAKRSKKHGRQDRQAAAHKC